MSGFIDLASLQNAKTIKVKVVKKNGKVIQINVKREDIKSFEFGFEEREYRDTIWKEDIKVGGKPP